MLRELFDSFVLQKNYPCVAARAAAQKGDVRMSIYPELGTGRFASALAQDLDLFLTEYQRTQARWLSFVALYTQCEFTTEAEFESALWKELSAVAALPEYQAPWDPLFASDPAHPKFCFSFKGHALFVVGLHPESSRHARRFEVPALVFNLYAQFEALDEETEYYPMVRTNRARDRAFQGNVNPMVERYAEHWESIQFSGRENSPNWKCPFQHAQKGMNPITEAPG